MIDAVVAENEGFGHTLSVVREPYGFFFSPPGMEKEQQDEIGKYLSGYYRENPQLQVKNDEYLLPVATIFSNIAKDAKGNGTTLLADIMRANGVHDAASAKAYFRDYARTVLTGQLGLFARYGIALEAHQQNTYVAFSKEGRLRKTVVQDIVSNTHVYSPLMKCNKRFADFSTENEQRLLFDPNLHDPVQHVFHTILKSHLLPVAAVVSREFDVGKSELMDVLKQEIHDTLQAAKTEHTGKLSYEGEAVFEKHLADIEAELLEKPTWDKAALTMLLTHTFNRVGVEQPNAFARHYG